MTNKITRLKTVKQVFLSKYAALGLGVSLFVATSIFCVWNQREKENLTLEFNMASKDAVDKINQQLDKYSTVILSASAFLGNSKNISHIEFERYISSLQLEKNYGELKAINYAYSVSAPNYKSFMENLQSEYKNYLDNNPQLLEKILKNISKNETLKPFEENYIIAYSQPISVFYDYIGFNMSQDAEVKKAIEEARDKNESISSGKIHNLTDKDGKNHLTIWFRVPVFSNNKLMGADGRKQYYLGSVGAGVDLDSFLSNAILQNPKLNKANFQVFEKNKGKTTKTLLIDSSYKRKSNQENWPSFIQVPNYHESELLYRGFFKISDKQFEIIIGSQLPKEYYAHRSTLFTIALLLGVTIFTAWMLAITMFNSRRQAHSIAEMMTRDLRDMAWYDHLTALYNRARSLEFLKEKIITYPDEKFLLMFIDLDGFKKVNDTLGHEAGDVVLSQYATRLMSLFEGTEDLTLGRVGGDEFILICNIPTNCERSMFVDMLAEKVVSATHQSFEVKSHKFIISQSIGIVFYPETGTTAEELLRKSDMAMYTNKKEKSLSYSVYSKEIEEKLVEKTKIESELLNAISNNELRLVFQPKMRRQNASNYSACGAEVLIRWKSAKFGEVSPAKFIKIAEENGSIYELTLWIIDRVCEKVKLWQEKYNFQLPVAVNLSAQQFLSEKLCIQILDHVEKSGVDPKSLVFEITEGTVMKNPEFASQMLKKFTDKGFKFSIDDFGTGYSSLSYLTKLPVHELKIDRSFVCEAKKSKNADSVIIAIIAMAHKLNLKVVAEGVETSEQLNFLQQNSCDEYQGYFFSKPLEEKDFISFLDKPDFDLEEALHLAEDLLTQKSI